MNMEAIFYIYVFTIYSIVVYILTHDLSYILSIVALVFVFDLLKAALITVSFVELAE